MRVDEFRKTWIKNFPESELKKYQHAVEVCGDPLLKIWSEAYDRNDSLMEGGYSVHYSGKGFLDDFWNTLIELRPTIPKKEEPKKKRAPRKTTKKKATPKKKVVAKKKAPVRRRRVKKEPASLMEF